MTVIVSSQSVEDYLRAIHKMSERGEAARTTELAETLGVTPASVTEMIQKLAAEGLLEYEPRKGAKLTARGMVEAQKIVRKHRLLERFLHDILKMKTDRVHDEACRLEHALSDDVADALCRVMEQPTTCPDDNKPIPPCVLEAEDCGECETARSRESLHPRLVTQLSNLRAGDQGIVTFVRGGKHICERLHAIGVTPGVQVRVLNTAPLRGPLEVAVRGSTIALGRNQAAHVFVEIQETSTGDEATPHAHHIHHGRWRGRR